MPPKGRLLFMCVLLAETAVALPRSVVRLTVEIRWDARNRKDGYETCCCIEGRLWWLLAKISISS